MFTKVRIFTFLAFPAHCWLWCAAKLVGCFFEHGPVDEDGNIDPED